MWVCGLIELYFGDESGFTMQPYIPYAWQKKGEQIRIFARKERKRLNVFALMKLDSTVKFFQKQSNLDGDFIAASIDTFAQQKHPKPLVIVLDNSPIHRCQAVSEHLDKWEQFDSVFLFFLPKYSPHLNPIEILWRFIKYKWLHKHHYRSWNKLVKAINHILANCGSLFSIHFKELTKNILQFNSA